MNKRYAIIGTNDNVVSNIIVWDGVSPYNLKSNTIIIQNDYCSPGWLYDPLTETFTDPNDPGPISDYPTD